MPMSNELTRKVYNLGQEQYGKQNMHALFLPTCSNKKVQSYATAECVGSATLKFKIVQPAPFHLFSPSTSNGHGKGDSE